MYYSGQSGDCLKFGRRFIEAFYKAVECRKDEMKCGKNARWYLEKLKGNESNEAGVSDSKAHVIGR